MFDSSRYVKWHNQNHYHDNERPNLGSGNERKITHTLIDYHVWNPQQQNLWKSMRLGKKAWELQNVVKAWDTN
jgi:hypothetical protein